MSYVELLALTTELSRPIAPVALERPHLCFGMAGASWAVLPNDAVPESVGGHLCAAYLCMCFRVLEGTTEF